jgi:hypothetical protein
VSFPAHSHSSPHARLSGPRRRSRLRAASSGATDLLAFVLVWFTLVVPDQLTSLTPTGFLRLPAEGLLIVAVSLLLPTGAARALTALVGVLIGLQALDKVADLGFLAALGRPFRPLTDWSYLASGFGVLRGSLGQDWSLAAVVGAALLVLALLACATWSLSRLLRLTARHRSAAGWTLTTLVAAWTLGAALGVQAADPLVGPAPPAGPTEQQVVQEQASEDPFARTPAADLLTGLRGKDVLIAFVESYGRVAVQDRLIAPRVGAVLDAGTESLAAAGFSARSAFLTSPTFGGVSWLAHSTLQSGLWIDSQQRYDQLVGTGRFTLSDAFERAGWRTVDDVPANTADWPEGRSFYHYDKVYDERNVGYAGPSFSYATVPDQYTLVALRRNELARPHRAPVMAEIDLVSSHGPWAPLPHQVGWDQLGDGSVFREMAAKGSSPEALLRSPGRVKAAYGQSIAYSLGVLISFVQTFPDPDLVLVLLGDHQPATLVSGAAAGHDVPITIVARDRSVLDRLATWGWQPGMRPGAAAPVWRMDTFRDRFLTAFGPLPGTGSRRVVPHAR